MSADPSPANPPTPLAQQQAFWNLWKTKLEVWQIGFVVLLGAIAASLFYVWQANEAHNHYYADLQAERERADSALRAEMFKTLVTAYFRRDGDQGSGVASDEKKFAKGETLSLPQVERDIMLSDLLSRNFETIDVRPLFEDLDRRLSQLLRDGTVHQNPALKRALELRERLRRVAAGATSRQRAQLKFPVTYSIVTSCRKGEDDAVVTVENLGEQSAATSGPGGLPNAVKGLWKDKLAAFRAVGVGDGEVLMDAFVGATRSVPAQFVVSYYDMPLLEQVRLESDERVAFSVARYASYDLCKDSELTKSLSMNEQRDVGGICLDLAEGCERVRLAITAFDKDFIAARDRPYLNELTNKQKNLFDLFR